MATSKPEQNREVVETGLEPEFFVTDTRIEDAGAGNLRIYCYSLRHENLVLLYTCIVPAVELAKMAQRALRAAADAYNLTQWDMDADEMAH